MTSQAIKKLDNLFDKFEDDRIFGYGKNGNYRTREQRNAFMAQLKEQAIQLRPEITDEESKSKLEYLIYGCDEDICSHRLYIEHEQFIVVETYDTKKKYVLLDTSKIGNNHYVDVCEYNDAIENKEKVLENDYLIKIKVSGGIYHKASTRIWQVREKSGESTILYGHKEVSTSTHWAY